MFTPNPPGIRVEAWVRPRGQRDLWRALASRRFAVLLLLIISVVFILGTIFPDASQLKERHILWLKENRPIMLWLGEVLSIQQFVRSIPFLALVGLLLLSLASCTWDRVRRRLRGGEGRTIAWPPAFGNEMRVFGSAPASEVGQEALRLLQRLRYRVAVQQDGGILQLRISRGSLGFWGSILFHVSMFLVVAGAVVTLLTKYSAQILLTEGQALVVEEGSFQQLVPPPRLGGSFPPVRMTMPRFVAEHKDDRFPVRFAATVALEDESGAASGIAREIEVEVNRALEYRGFHIYLERYGFAPNFIVRDMAGRVLLDAYVSLVLLRVTQEDSFRVPGTDLVMRAQLFPDYGRVDPQADFVVPRQPVIYLRLDQQGEILGSGMVPLRASRQFGDYQVEFADLRYWAGFGVTRDWGVPIISVGLLLASLGLLIRFSCYEKLIQVRVADRDGGSEIVVGGRSRFFPAFLRQELERITKQLSR